MFPQEYSQSTKEITLLNGGSAGELAHVAPAVRVRAHIGIDLTHRIWEGM